MFLVFLAGQIREYIDTEHKYRGDIDRYRKESQNKIIYTVVNVLNIFIHWN